MKKNHFWQTALFAGALLFGFTACSSDDNGAQQQNSSKEQTLTIALNLAQTSTMRTVATSFTDANESAINDVIVAIFDGSGNTVKIERVTSSDNATQVPGAATGTFKWANDGKKITLAAQGLAAGYEVYVVANAPWTSGGSLPGNQLEGCASKTAFEGISISAAETLSDSEAAGGNGKSTDFVMLGKGVLTTGSTTTFTAVQTAGGTDPINLYRMVSKVFIDKASTAFSGIYAGASYEITEIYLDNVPPTQKFDLFTAGINPTTPTINLNGGTNSTTTSEETYLTTGVLTTPVALTTTPADLDYYFYTMPNASAAHTRLVVKGNFTIGSNTTEIYYPIYLNWTWNDTDSKWEAVTLSPNTLPYLSSVTREAKKIYANEAFAITLNIKTIGVTDPKQDLDPQSVEVGVTVAPWAAITQNSTFQ